MNSRRRSAPVRSSPSDLLDAATTCSSLAEGLISHALQRRVIAWTWTMERKNWSLIFLRTRLKYAVCWRSGGQVIAVECYCNLELMFDVMLVQGISWGTPDHQGHQGGRVIQEFQALQEKLAEMVILAKKVNPAKMDSMGFQEDQVRKVIQVLLASLVLLESQERVDCQVETAKEVRRAKWAPLVHLDYVGRQGRRVKQVVQVHKERRGTQAIQAFKVERVTQESLEALDWVFQERQVDQAPLELQEPQDLLVHRDKMVNKVIQEYPARLVNLGRLGSMVLMEFQAFLEKMEFQGRQGSTGHQVKGAKTCTDS
ncbi:hypothetical protein BSKO_09650 [Bryopsis sp. KO-2023]|nr:hypothetical protein BSKO_09650 [Bryopsis sp. KO-2023]